MNELKGSTRSILLLFLYIPEANFIAASFRMTYIRMFLFRTGLATNSYDYMRFSVHLWLSFDSLMAHQGKQMQSSEVNQFT